MKKLALLTLVFALIVGPAVAGLGASDGLGFSQDVGTSYMTLNAGPFVGDISVANIFGEYEPHTRLGLSVEAPGPLTGLYSGGLIRFNFKPETNHYMKLDSAHIFGGFEFDAGPVALKFQFGPRFTEDTVFYELGTYDWNLSIRILSNPLKLFTTGEA